MAKLQNIIFLKNKKGQSIVEYILLLGVLSSIAFSVYNNKRFKDFVGGKQGFFVSLRKGMEYSYRYGRQLDKTVDYDQAMNFQYGSNQHAGYFNSELNQTRFFTGTTPYGQ